MRGSLLSILLLASSSLHAAAADPAPVPPTPPVKPAAATPFKFPATRTPAAPPATSPGEALTLAADALYVIPSDEPFLLLASSPTLATSPVTITREAGPLRIRGKFLDGDGKVETRTYTAKHIAIVEPVKDATGRVELIHIPVGATDEKSAVRQLVDLGHAPQPPPPHVEPAPPPKPQPPPVPPEPKPVPKAGPLWLVFVDDGASVETAKIATNPAFLARMKAAGHKVHVYGVNDPAAVRNGYAKAAVKAGLPALIIVDEDGDVVSAVPRPGTVAGVEAEVKAVGQ